MTELDRDRGADVGSWGITRHFSPGEHFSNVDCWGCERNLLAGGGHN